MRRIVKNRYWDAFLLGKAFFWMLIFALCGCTEPTRAAVTLESLATKVGLAAYAGGSWIQIGAYDSLNAAQNIVIKEGLHHVRFTVEAPLDGPLCSREQNLGVLLNHVYDQDRTWFNGRLIGTTGDPTVSRRRLAFIPRVYLVPSDLIECGTNVFIFEIRKVTEAFWAGVNPHEVYFGEYTKLQEAGYAFEGTLVILQENIAIFLLAITVLMFAVFRRYTVNGGMQSFVLFSFASTLECMSVSFFAYRFTDYPTMLVRLNYFIVCLTLVSMIRFQGWFLYKDRLSKLCSPYIFWGTIVCLISWVFGIRDVGKAFETYKSITLLMTCLSMCVLALGIWPVKWDLRDMTMKLGLCIVNAGMFLDIIRMFGVHSWRNVSPYCLGIGVLSMAVALFWGVIEQYEETLISAKTREERAKLDAVVATTQMIAHDVIKPFSQIKTLMQLVGSQGDGIKAVQLSRKYLPTAEHAMRSATAILQSILQLGAAPRLMAEPCELRDIIKGSISEVFCTLFCPQIHFEYDLRHEQHALVDAGQLQRVFSNILTNAAQAMNLAGKIQLKTSDVASAEKRFIRFSIANSGSSISEENIEKVFEPFYTSNGTRGTGLGLAIVKKIIDDHGGAVTCRSDKENEIVEFEMLIPAADTREAVSADDILPSNAGSIYIVDAH